MFFWGFILIKLLRTGPMQEIATYAINVFKIVKSLFFEMGGFTLLFSSYRDPVNCVSAISKSEPNFKLQIKKHRK